MKALTVVFVALAIGVAARAANAQDRGQELDKAYEEARSAALALKDAEARRDEGVEPQPGLRASATTPRSSAGTT